ncbi:MAG: hypothetical protein N4A45_03010 [Flavobacteriales bacterium]|jgi:hypothetical protein|nr:hypothetical protein [Flavobacteriales bacterium]
MLRTKLAILFLVLGTQLIQGQVGIGTTSPDESAILEVNSTSKGFLPPRMDNNSIQSINNAAKGLMIYCTDCCNTGSLVIFNGTDWRSLIVNCGTNLIPIFIPDSGDDFDGDGISNTEDIDDDNDGIPDVDEQCGTNVESFGQMNITNHVFTYNINNVSHLVIDIALIDNAMEIYINNQNIFQAQTVTVNGVTALQKSMDIQGQDSQKKAFKVDMEFVNPNDQAYSTGDNRIYSPWDARSDGLPRVRFVINEFGNVTAFGTAHYSSSHPSYNNGLKPVRLRGYQANGTMGSVIPFSNITLNPGNNEVKIVSTNESGTEHFIGKFTSKEHCIDIDNDGHENQYDLDSDGDGCSDALEVGATASTTPNFTFPSTNVGVNGLHNSLETAVDNGIIGYNVINNFNNSTNSNIHSCN